MARWRRGRSLGAPRTPGKAPWARGRGQRRQVTPTRTRGGSRWGRLLPTFKGRFFSNESWESCFTWAKELRMTSSNKVDIDSVEKSASFTEPWVQPGRWEMKDSRRTCCRMVTTENKAFAWKLSTVVILAMSWRKMASSSTQFVSKNSNIVTRSQREKDWDSIWPLIQVSSLAVSSKDKVTQREDEMGLSKSQEKLSQTLGGLWKSPRSPRWYALPQWGRAVEAFLLLPTAFQNFSLTSFDTDDSLSTRDRKIRGSQRLAVPKTSIHGYDSKEEGEEDGLAWRKKLVMSKTTS